MSKCQHFHHCHVQMSTLWTLSCPVTTTPTNTFVILCSVCCVMIMEMCRHLASHVPESSYIQWHNIQLSQLACLPLLNTVWKLITKTGKDELVFITIFALQSLLWVPFSMDISCHVPNRFFLSWSEGILCVTVRRDSFPQISVLL